MGKQVDNPRLAATFKLLYSLDQHFRAADFTMEMPDGSDPAQLPLKYAEAAHQYLQAVLSQPPLLRGSHSYGEMREFIKNFMTKYGVG